MDDSIKDEKEESESPSQPRSRESRSPMRSRSPSVEEYKREEDAMSEGTDTEYTEEGQTILRNIDQVQQELPLREIVEGLIQISECANLTTSQSTHNKWSAAVRIMGSMDALPQHMRDSMMELTDPKTGKPLSWVWQDTCETFMKYEFENWQNQYYQKDAKQLCSTLWINFIKAYNYNPMPLATTLATALYCTRRFLDMNMYMTVTTKVIQKGKLRALENQLKWTSQGRDVRRAYKRPTKYQLRTLDRGGALLDSATRNVA